MVLIAVLLLQGCHALQATQGQLSLMASRQPIERVIADPATSSEVRARLQLAVEVRTFAAEELGLVANGSYSSYVELDRPYVLWNVVVTPEFSVEPRTWCAPFAGCTAYRGYFKEVAAEQFADRYRRRGDDVRVSGVQAYSTLGWFRDPVLSSMLQGDELSLIAVIIHELAHQRLYVPSDSGLSEAFATVVEIEGVRRWLAARGDEAGMARFEARQQRVDRFVSELSATRDQLALLYASGLSEEEMRARKSEAFEGLRDRLGESELRNNADLAAVATYRELVPGLQALLAEAGGDLETFYTMAESLARLDADTRRARLQPPRNVDI